MSKDVLIWLGMLLMLVGVAFTIVASFQFMLAYISVQQEVNPIFVLFTYVLTTLIVAMLSVSLTRCLEGKRLTSAFVNAIVAFVLTMYMISLYAFSQVNPLGPVVILGPASIIISSLALMTAEKLVASEEMEEVEAGGGPWELPTPRGPEVSAVEEAPKKEHEGTLFLEIYSLDEPKKMDIEIDIAKTVEHLMARIREAWKIPDEKRIMLIHKGYEIPEELHKRRLFELDIKSGDTIWVKVE